ncbi:hypothetical protein [Puerhibacterium puerhi]|uniref:hypothetical protein n=1 Tax=Puerhibacterium puerhi TaxID=2692623 RepID=UPI001358ABD5|nr:hypothetical protein [Puerhibacterium puerhi]
MPGPARPEPAGYVDSAAAAAVLDRPVALLVRWASTRPEQLPPHVVIDGAPNFDPTTPVGAAAGSGAHA